MRGRGRLAPPAPLTPLTPLARPVTMAPMKAYLDGKFVDVNRLRISAHDAAVQHAVGLFETMRASGGRVFRLDDHIARLIGSARELALTDRLRHDPLCEAVEATLAENSLTEARVRLTVTGGDLALLPSARAAGKGQTAQPSVLIIATEPTVYPEALFERGVSTIVADPKANPFDPMAGHKTLNYWSRLRTLAEAAAVSAGEALWFTVTNHLCSGAVSNAILIKDGQLLTPFARGEEADGAIPSPVLPGITRAAACDLAEQLDLPVQRRMLTISDVLEADEIMLTNSSWLVLPVVQVEKTTIGHGQPGPITQRLRQAMLEQVKDECQAG